MRADRLFGVQLLREVRVEPPEIDHFRRRVDFCLERRLRLSQHRRGVQRCAPRRRQQLRRAQKHRRTILERPTSPVFLRLRGGGDGLVYVTRLGDMPIRQHVPVIVRHHRLAHLARADLPVADDDGDVDLLGCHRRKASLQLLAFRRSGKVAEVGLVDRQGYARIS
jgi:hypothetical protein